MKNGLVRNWMTHKVVTVAPETHLSDARRIMNGEKIRSLPVVKNDRLVGIVTRRGLLRADISALQETNWNIQVDLNSEPVSSVMTASPITTSPETALPKAARVMLENKITALPVMNGSTRPVGILTTSDLFRAIIEEVPALKQKILVQEYMSRNVVSITSETSILEAHRLMGVERIRSLPVVEEGKLVGIVTRTDLMSADLSRFVGKNQQELALKIQTRDVSNMMSRSLITIAPDAPITEAARKLLENKIHALPVVDNDGKMVGILTETDLFRMIVQKFF
jgi:CBS domain-containing protein